MSPALRQVAPTGSVQTKQIEPKKAPSKPVVQRLNDIAIVSRAQSFQSASEKLASASRRLETEAQQQAGYWEQMATIRSNRWPVSRLPNNDRAIVVHFGSTESSPQYRNKGISILRQDANGDLILPGQISEQQQKVLSITVRRKGLVTGHFRCIRDETTTAHSIEKGLRRARDSLFQEELFNEASKEARGIANMGVKARSSSVEFDISPECSVALNHSSQPFVHFSSSQPDKDLASFVSNNLQLMLIAEHQQRHTLRSQHKPLPLTLNQRPSADYALLRPVIAHLRHHSAISPLLRVIKAYRLSLNQAGISCLSVSEKNDHSNLQNLSLQVLRRAVSSELTFNLPTQKSLRFKAETYLAAPLFGTQFLPIQYEGDCGSTSCAQTSSLGDVVNSLEDALARDIGCYLMQSEKKSSQLNLDQKFPLVLSIVRKEAAQATLAITCKRDTVHLCYTRVKDGVVWKALWKDSGLVLDPKDEQKITSNTLRDVVDSWIAKL